MTGKANAVFIIGLILIGLNFWVSGQSTALWTIIAHSNPATSKPSGPTKPYTPPVIGKGVLPGPGGAGVGGGYHG